MDGWMGGWMDEWVTGWMDGWSKRAFKDCLQQSKSVNLMFSLTLQCPHT